MARRSMKQGPRTKMAEAGGENKGCSGPQGRYWPYIGAGKPRRNNYNQH